jgi:hypothetical protein
VFSDTLAPGGNLKVIKFGGRRRKFIVYEDNNVLKQNRHQIHLASLDYRPELEEERID